MKKDDLKFILSRVRYTGLGVRGYIQHVLAMFYAIKGPCSQKGLEKSVSKCIWHPFLSALPSKITGSSLDIRVSGT